MDINRLYCIYIIIQIKKNIIFIEYIICKGNVNSKM